MKFDSKGDIPYELLNELEPILYKIRENCINSEPDKNLFRFVDINEEFDFYFYIQEYKTVNDELQILIQYRPYSKITTGKKQLWIKVTDIAKYLDPWIQLLQSYRKVRSVFDDPITESFKDHYYTEFEIIDEERGKTLKPKDILLLDSYFERINENIDTHLNDSNVQKIEGIKKDISELRENLSSKTKFWIVNKICWIWAKMTKLGPKFMKDFLNEANKQIVKESFSAIIEIGKDALT